MEQGVKILHTQSSFAMDLLAIGFKIGNPWLGLTGLCVGYGNRKVNMSS